MNKKRNLLLTLGIVLLLAALLLGILPAAIRAVATQRFGLDDGERSGQDIRYLGLARDGRFEQMAPRPIFAGTLRLTRIAMQAAQLPESGEVDLSPYEGQAIVIEGHDGGGWIYSARVVKVTGPLATILLRYAFGQ